MPIPNGAEERALATAFFRDELQDGQLARDAIVPYRVFASPNAFLDSAHAAAMQGLVLGLPLAIACRDIASLLAARNWRFHAIASGAIALAPAWCPQIQVRLWMRIRLGCWAPQLLAAATLADAEFMPRAQRLLTLRSTHPESAAAVTALMSWLALHDELQHDPRAVAEKMSQTGPAGVRAIAWHHAFSRERERGCWPRPGRVE